MDSERVQKTIANAGYCARRRAEELIREGRVEVNGKVIGIGSKCRPSDVITIDGKILVQQKKRYILMFKPRGYLTTLEDPRGRKTVYDILKLKERVFPIGRLDLNTTGLLLLTNDGDFANHVMHPRYEVDKTYLVQLEEGLSKQDVHKLERGISIEGVFTWPARVSARGRNAYAITIHEGRNRIIRKMMRKLKKRVVSLKRVGVGDLTLKGMKEGEWRDLTRAERKDLLEYQKKYD